MIKIVLNYETFLLSIDFKEIFIFVGLFIHYCIEISLPLLKLIKRILIFKDEFNSQCAFVLFFLEGFLRTSLREISKLVGN